MGKCETVELVAVEVRESSRKCGEQVGITVGPEQPLELPAPVLAQSARDQLIPPNTSTNQYYSLVLVLVSGTYVFPESTLFN